MKRLAILCLAPALLFAGLAPAPDAQAQSRSEQSEARKEMRAGNILKSREIEARVLPTMRGHDYLGFEYDPAAMAYRLKFIRDGRVSFVDVDAKTGKVIRRSR